MMNNIFSFIYNNTPLKFYVQSFWRDEAFSYLLAKQNIMQILLSTAKDYNPPLYYLLLHAWMILFGSSEIALRTFSFIFFLGTLYVLGLLLMKTLKLSVKQILLYLLFFALNPLLHYYAFEARMYSLFAFITTLSFYYLLKKEFGKYTLVSIVGLYTHYFMIFPLLGQIMYLFFRRNKGDTKRHVKIYLKIFLFYVPWILIVLFNKPPFSQDFWVPKVNFTTIINSLALVLTGYEQMLGYTYPWIPVIAILIYSILACYFFVVNRSNPALNRHKEPINLLFLSWVIIPLIAIIAISFVKPIFLPRYMIFTTVGLLFYLVNIIQRIPSRMRYFFLILLFFFTSHYSSVQITKRAKANIKKPLLEIKKLMKETDVVFVTHEYNFHTAQYYIGGNQVYIYGKTYGEIPSFVGKILIPKDRIVNNLPVYPRKAFILKDDLTYSVQALY